MTSHIDRLGRRLANVEEGLKRLARSNNLGHSSFDGGAIIQNADDGTPGSVFGVNFDGTNGVVPLTSPPPPTPKWTYTAGEPDPVTGIIGGVRVRWGGEFENGDVAPLGFASVEVHVSDTPNFSALLFDTMKTNIVSARGGEVLIPLPPGTYYVRLVCRSTAGRAGAPSAPFGPVVAAGVTKEDLGFKLEDLAGNKIFRGSDAPVGTTDAPLLYGDLWLKTPDNVAYQFSPPDPGSWVQVQDQNIVKALNDAADAAGLASSAGLTASQAHDLANAAQSAASAAQQQADQASADAQAALDAAALAQQSGGAGINVYRQTSAPTGGTYHINDLWLDTAHNNQLFAWSGGAWVASDDQRIVTALTNASSAQALAGTKTTLFGQTSPPTSTGRAIGDTWIDTDDSNKVYVWTGAAWTATLFGSGAISATARQLGAVTTYRQTTAPTGTLVAGDLWIDSATNTLYSYSGTAWVKSQDTGIQQALTNAATAQSTANAKITSYYQTSAPTTGMSTGDFWLDTGNGNRLYRYSGTAWVVSQDTAVQTALTNAGTAQATADRKVQVFYRATAPANPADNLGAGDLWLDTANGNKLNRWSGTAWAITQDVAIQTALTTATGKTTTFYQISAPSTTGRVTGDLWVDTDDGNKIYTWSGSAWAPTLLSSQALNVTARQLGAITIYRQTSAPTAGVLDGDYWLDSGNGNKAYLRVAGVWTVVQDTSITSALTNAATAQATADGKARIFYQTSAPTGLVAGDLGDEWVDTDDAYVTYTWSGTAWVKNAISTSSFQPASLVVSTVAATGSVTAALLEAILVLATTIVAGNVNGTHAKMTTDGFHVFKAQASGAPVEVIRLGVAATNDFFAIVNASGMLAASIDDTGRASFSGLSSQADPIFQGTPFTKWLSSASGIGNGNPAFPGAEHTIGWIDSSIGGVKAEVGLTEIVVNVSANRWYWIGYDVNYIRGTDTEAVFRLRYSPVAQTPSVTSPEIMRRNFSNVQPFYDGSAFAMGIWYPPASGTYRLLLTATAQGSGVIDIHTLNGYPAIICQDMGPRKPITAGVNRGGGGTNPPPAPAAPPKQDYVDLPSVGRASWRGDGSLMTGYGNDVYQGYEASNGDMTGMFWFDLPDITGTVDRVDVYLYFRQWWFNSGGTVIMNVNDGRGTQGRNYFKPKGDWYTSGWPKPGSQTVTVPSDWWPGFRGTGNAVNNGRYSGITLGPGGGTNQTYYGVATDARLRIWFTQ